MKFKFILFLLMMNILTGCSSLVIKDHLIGNYFLTAPDIDEQLSLTYRSTPEDDLYIGIIPPTVFAVGFNEKYIIVKQHPYNGSQVSQKNPNYYIVLVEKELIHGNANNLIGPLTLDQFSLKRHELGIPNSLTFSKEYENLK